MIGRHGTCAIISVLLLMRAFPPLAPSLGEPKIKNRESKNGRKSERNGIWDPVVYCTGLQGEKEGVAAEEASEENAHSCCQNKTKL